MFKPGQRVRAKDSSKGAFTKGKIYEVVKVTDDWGGTVYIKVDDSGSKTNGWGILMFEAVGPKRNLPDWF